MKQPYHISFSGGRTSAYMTYYLLNNFSHVYGRDVFGRKTEKTPKKYIKKKIGMKLRLEVYERDGFKCVTCGVQKNLTLDHIKPEILGGASTIENLQTMCKSCNSSKGTEYDEPDEGGE
ncbi:hypothetical protein F885_01814 [Acinetobacter higginsii]|uniref:HNH endonuclease n=1 Tax=Acinetobacter higginsii TaxID=70347 RepID=UPI0002CDDAD3|nr:HNH endonuclease [Acinetobacter higginsii]ENX60706.1 hypothetical protein F885_01814 [Acinetobacter higginsii]